MKKYLPILAAALVVAMGVVFLLSRSNDNPASTDQAQQFSPPEACEIFTLEDAKKVLGDNVESAETQPQDASTDDIEVSQCLYSQPAGDTLASIQAQEQASILVRGAKTETGVQSNEEVFNGSLKPGEAQDVEGYGDAAFWNPQFGQLNIFKNNNWYILSIGISSPLERSLEDAKQLADLLIDKL